jgi:putative ABC transport system permease protein
VEHIRTLEDVRTESLASRIFARQLLMGFSSVGTVLTVVGVYGALALSIASRRREIAIRAAIGAHRGHIRNLVVGEGVRLVAAGVAVGAGAATVMARMLESFLFDVEAADPLTLVGAGLLFVSVTLFACWMPTIRAARVDPLEALRSE